jgi:hypothetical protein
MGTIYRKFDLKPIPPAAELVERRGKKIVRFRDERGLLKSHPLSDDGTKMVVERSSWYFDYDGPDGRKTGVKGYPDRDATLKEMQDRERDAHREKVGLPVVDRTPRQVEETLQDWLNDLRRLNRDDVYVANMNRFLDQVRKDLNWTVLGSIRPKAFAEWLARYKAGDRSDRSTNQYLESVRAFLNWCVNHNLLLENPIAKLKAIPGTKTVRNRRALSLEELNRLLDASPPYRRVIYLNRPSQEGK